MVKDIAEAIRQAEQGTTGEIRVHLAKRPGPDVMASARKTFVKLKMHRTRLRNGVLLYVAPKERVFAIVGDEGIHAKAGADHWAAARDAMLEEFKHGRLKEGILAGVRLTGEKLRQFFPADGPNGNELPDTVTES